MKKLLYFTLIAACALSGCSTFQNRPNKIKVFYPTDAGSVNAHTKLVEAAVSASDSLNQIAAIEKATHPKAKLKEPVNPDSIRLGTLASVDWTGPIEPLVQKL